MKARKARGRKRVTRTRRKYKVAQNPKNKKWYVVGKTGKYWVVVSSGYKTKKLATEYMKMLPKAERDQFRELLGI